MDRETLTAYNLGTNYASATYNFVPNGAKVTHIHDIIETASCNACHDQLSAHGGSRRGMTMCVLCHHAAEHRPEHRQPWTPRFSFTRSTWARACPVWWPARLIFRPSTRSEPLITRRWSSRPTPGDPRRLRGVPFTNHRRGAEDRISDQSDARGLRVLPRQREFRHRRESPGRPAVRRQPMRDLPYPARHSDFDASILGAHVVPTASSLLSGLAVNITKLPTARRATRPRFPSPLRTRTGIRFRFRSWARFPSPWRGRPPITATPSSEATSPRLDT